MEDQRRPTWGYTATSRKTRNFAGGAPHLLERERWPKDGEGRPLGFLFQCDLSEAPDVGLNLPRRGLLQVFFRVDPLWGMNLDSVGDAPKGSLLLRVVEGAEDREGSVVPRKLQEVFKTDSDYPLSKPLERVYYEGALAWVLPSEGTVEAEVAADSNGWDDDEEEVDSPLREREDSDEEEAEEDAYPEFEFHLGGYPFFAQEDFRQRAGDFTLVLGSESGDHVSWGDMGNAGVWLPEEAADGGDFSQAFLYWDCY